LACPSACLSKRERLLLKRLIEGEVLMKRNKTLLILSLMLVAMALSACSMNRQTPSELDNAALEGDVRAAISQAVAGKTFDLGIDVAQGGRVTLSGNVSSASDRDAIVARVQQVSGVTSVNADRLTVQ
jgi:BON domain